MYNNQKRVELVKPRIYERNCQQQRHGIYGLSAACMVLFAFLAGSLHVVAGHTQMAVQGMYGSGLLYQITDRERGLRDRKRKNALSEKEDKRDER